jgi:hypothetical protein
MISEDVQVFWAALQGGEVHQRCGRSGWDVWQAGARGGWSPVAGRARGRVATCRGGPRRRSRGSWAATPSPSGRYRSTSAHAAAWGRAARPKPAKLATNLALRGKVEQYLQKRYSPEQICGRLRVEFCDDPEMWVCAEGIVRLFENGWGAVVVGDSEAVMCWLAVRFHAAAAAVISSQTSKRSAISLRHWDALIKWRRERKCSRKWLNADRNRWACPGEAKRFITRSRILVG